MDALVGPVFDMVKLLCAPVVRRVGYLINLRENVEKLREEVRELNDRRDDVERETERGRMLGKIRTRECESWFEEVKEKQNQVNQIEQEYSEGSKCVCGLRCPNCYSLLKLGKQTVMMIEAIHDLKEKGKFERGMVVDPLPSVAAPMPGPSIQVETAAGRNLKEIMECLMKDEVRRIGMVGMGGVGKTTILKNLNNQPELTRMFQIVIWVTVSKDWMMRNVQKEIAKKLSLDIMDDDSHDIVKSKLFVSLKEKKFLLLLDDMWQSLDLNDVGVPTPTKENGCKLVLTTRDEGVCRWMNTDRDIRVNTLADNEAWNLFREQTGEVVDSPAIQTIARNVLKECGGLPLVILAVGASLRKEKDAKLWQDALRELRSPSTSQIEGMEEQVFARLEFSYDRLKGDNIKNCFLYCALFPEDYFIHSSELIMKWRAEGFIDGVERFKEVHPKGLAMLKKLKEACLLEECDYNALVVVSEFDYVTSLAKMHDVVRDMALRITSKKADGCKFLVRTGVGLTEPPREEEWKGVERVSIMNTDIKTLPDRPECPTLSTLLLDANSNLMRIPDTFFEHMHALRVLDLSWTGIASLPSSLSQLINLRALYLTGCPRLRIGESSNLGGLKRLEVLVLGCRRIHLSSSKIGELTSLMIFEISPSFRSRKCTFPRLMVSRLSVLESLEHWWEKKDEETVIKEIASLRNLDSFAMVFPTVELLELFGQTRSHLFGGNLMLSEFNFSCHYSLFDSMFPIRIMTHLTAYRRLRFFNPDTIITEGVITVLKHADGFHLIDHRSIKGISEFGVGNMKELKHCIVEESVMECFINGNELQEAAFPRLEKLDLFHLQNLRTIWEGVVQRGSLSSLKHLKLVGCHRLRNIFSSGLVQHLVNLETLDVFNCLGLEEIIGEEEEVVEHDDADVVVLLPKLKNIYLYKTQQLRIICKRALVAWPSLQYIFVDECPNLKSLQLMGIHSSPALTTIEGDEDWWDELEWENDIVKRRFEPLFKPIEN